MALGDLDLDGHLDAVTLGQYASVSTLRGQGDGTFELSASMPADGSLDAVRVGVADVDGDGWPDVLHSGSLDETVYVRRNDGTGALLPKLGFAAGANPEALALADLDGDHLPDVVAGAEGQSFGIQGELAVLRNGADFRWTDLGSALAGTLVSVPPTLQVPLVTSVGGSIVIPWSAWPSAAPGQDWYFQFAIKDPAAVKGVALSNALKAVEP
ncbi:MAG TPA: VCBS repeat-containing protein [Planctomycetota bacterium]|nr:VCBS repeat-containing protein [Planctomycetota bacterium]